jgi:hypothetical protein
MGVAHETPVIFETWPQTAMKRIACTVQRKRICHLFFYEALLPSAGSFTNSNQVVDLASDLRWSVRKGELAIA